MKEDLDRKEGAVPPGIEIPGIPAQKMVNDTSVSTDVQSDADWGGIETLSVQQTKSQAEKDAELKAQQEEEARKQAQEQAEQPAAGDKKIRH